MKDLCIPSIDVIKDAHDMLCKFVLQTPAWRWRTGFIESILGESTEVHLKLELFQHTGTFKVRGALLGLRNLSPDQMVKGVTTVSAGNHAAAVAYASRMLKTSAKVVMPKSANPARVKICQSLGAEVVLADDVYVAFEIANDIEKNEGRAFIHPFESEQVTLGTATLGLEFLSQISEKLDAVVIPIGGGGLCSGVAAAVKQLMPDCKVYGVEPKGANTMSMSFKSGKPEAIKKIDTIADSLAAPYSAPYSFEVNRKFVDEIVLVSDDALCEAIYVLFKHMKLAVEPAGAASTAAILGPLREILVGKKIGLIICGANIDSNSFSEYLLRGNKIHTI